MDPPADLAAGLRGRTALAVGAVCSVPAGSAVSMEASVDSTALVDSMAAAGSTDDANAKRSQAGGAHVGSTSKKQLSDGPFQILGNVAGHRHRLDCLPKARERFSGRRSP